MAVTLSASAHVDYGAVYDVPQTGVTVAVTVTPSSAADGRMVTKWGGDGASDQSFNLQCYDSARLLWGIKQSGSTLNIQQTATGVVGVGTRLRIVGRFAASTTPEIWVDGVQASTTTFFSDGLPVSASGAALGIVSAGFETDESINGMAGDYSELAVWTEAVPDWVILGYAKGMSPRYYRSNGALYCPMLSASYLVNEWAATGGTNTSGTAAAHPAMYYP